MSALIKYDTACRALAEAKSVDEVKTVRDVAMAMKLYARQAGNKDLEADAFEIRKRAERRLGEMMMQGSDDRAPEGRPKKRVSEKPVSRPTLREVGIGDKNLAQRAREAYAMPPADFEKMIGEGRSELKKAAERRHTAKIVRKEKHRKIAAKAATSALSHAGPFPLIYADPPWKWGHFGEADQENEAGKGRTPDQHYPTLTYDEIKDFRVGTKLVKEIAHKDAALFLWCTSANIKFALEVMEAWDFTYKAQGVWVKDKLGLGLVFRNKHEVLLYGTRGSMPGPQYQPPSIFEYPRGRHSAKPPEIRAEIEKMYPDFGAATRLELFARQQTENWTSYGFEADSIAA